MASIIEDTVIDFDLNFLNQTRNVLIQSKLDKQQKAVLIAKRKTLATDSLIKKYYEKKEKLEMTERYFLSSKEESKQICLDYKNTLEKLTALEQATSNIKSRNLELENTCSALENKLGAINSHANQLQILVKEYETLIESLKIEKNLLQTNIKDKDKKISQLEKEHKLLVSHQSLVKDVVLENVELCDKSVLKNYANPKENLKLEVLSNKKRQDEVLEDHGSPLHDDIEMKSNASLKQTSIFDVVVSNLTSKEKHMNNNDSDSDYSNEIISDDTGRGSSLCSSDADKCFNSPEFYMNDSPLTTETKRMPQVSRGCSPIDFGNQVKINMQSKGTSPIKKTQTKSMRDKAVSPIIWTEITATKSLNVLNDRLLVTPILPAFKTSMHCDPNNSERKEISDCNIDDQFIDSNSSDCEVEMIFNRMRLSQELITPMPRTPSKSRTDSVSTPSRHSQNEHICPEAQKLREDYKSLQSKMTDLVKEVFNIKQHLTDSSLIERHELTDHETSINNQNSDMPENILNTLSCDQSETVQQPVIEFSSSPVNKDNLIVNEPLTDAVNTENDNDSSILSSTDFETSSNVLSRLQFEEPLPSEDSQHLVSNVSNNCSDKEVDNQPSENKINDESLILNKSYKRRKLTKLERIRNNLIPKSKIRLQSSKMLQCKNLDRKRIKVPIISKNATEADSSKTLNDKAVYEKALKVMAEMKSKQKPCNTVVPNVANVISKNKIDENLKDLKDKIIRNENCSSDMNDCKTKSPSSINSNCGIIRTTRSRSKYIESNAISTTKTINSGTNDIIQKTDNLNVISRDSCISEIIHENKTSSVSRKRNYKHTVSNSPEELPCKRMLRSSIKQVNKENNSNKLDNNDNPPNNPNILSCSAVRSGTKIDNNINSKLSASPSKEVIKSKNVDDSSDCFDTEPQDSLFCKMIEKYGQSTVKPMAKKIPESALNNYCKIFEGGIKYITEQQPDKTIEATQSLLNEVEHWDEKNFIACLMQYLMNPQRKEELFNKIYIPPAPPMTKSEQAVLYLINQLNARWPSINLVELVLTNIEYTLFKLNKTPEFSTIESMSHFYAVLCRFYQAKSRLRLFVIDAMYCIQFKAVTLIKQCMEVWMHILPLAHMSLAKSPLVTCLVYLMHFYKCEDKFNRVQDIRNLLTKKYYYVITEWNEKKILEMFKSAVIELKDDLVEIKMLRIALIIIAKRQGPKWCQNNIVKLILQPMIDNGSVPARTRRFCISMLGPLIKPYPNEMKVHCEVAMNQLIDILNKKPSTEVAEAIFTSLIYMSKHNLNRVLKALISWKPHKISPEFEGVLRDFVKEKPIKAWKTILSRLDLSNG